jgi:hypothetical protein
MRGYKWVLVLGVAAMLCSPALAQRGRGFGFGRGGGSAAFLLRNKSVQDELKIDADQAQKVQDALTKVRDDLKDEYAKFGRGSDASQEERAAARKKTGEAEMKALAGVLKEDQIKRLHQIQHQLQGIAMFDDADVQKTLKLTDEQKDKIKDIQKDLRKEIETIFPPGEKPDFSKFQENQKKVQGLQKEAMVNVTKTLNADQKKQVEELTGKPFEMKFEFGRGRGGKPGKPRTDF